MPGNNLALTNDYVVAAIATTSSVTFVAPPNSQGDPHKYMDGLASIAEAVLTNMRYMCLKHNWSDNGIRSLLLTVMTTPLDDETSRAQFTPDYNPTSP